MNFAVFQPAADLFQKGLLLIGEIPDDKTAIGSFYDLRDEADDNVKAIIEELAATQDLKAGSDEQKVGALYTSYIRRSKSDV